MTVNYKDNSLWKQSTPYVNVNGTWKIAKSAWVNVNSLWKSWFLQGGLNDGGFATYDNVNSVNSTVLSTAIQSDGKIIMGGDFTTFNGVTSNYILRLNTNGTIDTSFNVGSGFSNGVRSLAIQSDGKIIVGGNFTQFNGVTSNHILRLNTDGTRDTSFNVGSGFSNGVRSLAIQSDGKIIVGGDFTTFNGVTSNYILRLNTNGTIDTTFNIGSGFATTGFSLRVRSSAIQSDGKIIIGGDFTTFNGSAANAIVRLNTNGTIDTTFNTGSGFSSRVYSLAIQADGKIIVGGNSIQFNGVTVNGIVRLNTNGTRDTAFNTGSGFNDTVDSIAIQSDGKIILGGFFTIFNGVTSNHILRLNTDGTRDTGFNIGSGFNFQGGAVSLAIQSDGKIIVGGFFTTFNGATVDFAARLNINGTLDNFFINTLGFNSFINILAIQSDGKIIVGGDFTNFGLATVNRIARLNTDGTRDIGFTTNTGSGFNSQIRSLAIQSDGKIILGGDFTTFNGSTVNRIVRLNTDGTRDTSFNTVSGFNSLVFSTAIQSDGKIIVGGNFTQFNGVTSNHILRLNTDGTRDTSFNVGSGFSNGVRSLAIQSDGKIIVGGFFTSYNSFAINRLIRLNTDGTRDTGFSIGSGFNDSVNSLAIQSDGKIITGGVFTIFNAATVNRIARLNTDGTRDIGFTTNTGSGFNSQILSLAIQSDGKIIVGGDFTNFGLATVNRIARLNTDGTRDIGFTNNTSLGFNLVVLSTAIQSDGKIIVGGAFINFNNIVRTRLARIGGDVSE